MNTVNFKVGDRVKVGEVFWIDVESFIGVDGNFDHGQNSKHGGLVDAGCTLVVRGIVDEGFVVSLRRNSTPYGSLAAIGSVFIVSLDFLDRQAGAVSNVSAKEKRMKALADEFCI